MSRSAHYFQPNSNSWDDYLSSSFSTMDPFSQGNSSHPLSDNDSGYTTDDDEPNSGPPLTRCKSVRRIHPMRYAKARLPSDDSGVGFSIADYLNISGTTERRPQEHLARRYRRKSVTTPLPVGQVQRRDLTPGNPDLTINTNRNRGNCLATGLRGNHILSSFEPTSGLRGAESHVNIQRQGHPSSLERVETNTDAVAARFIEIEAADGLARKRILEGHLDKIFRMALPPVCDLGAERKVQFVNGTSERGIAAEFACADEEKRGFRTAVRSRMQSIERGLGKLNCMFESRGRTGRRRSSEG